MNKVYADGDYVAVHREPVWREKANYLIRAHIGVDEKGLNEWEQLWVKKIGGGRFLLCCIPFFCYQLALGDEVEADERNTFIRVIRPSGQHGFRVWLGNLNNNGERSEVISSIARSGGLYEWSSENLVAISFENKFEAKNFTVAINEFIGRLSIEVESIN